METRTISRIREPNTLNERLSHERESSERRENGGLFKIQLAFIFLLRIN